MKHSQAQPKLCKVISNSDIKPLPAHQHEHSFLTSPPHLLSAPLPHPSHYSMTLNTTSMSSPSLLSPSPLLRDVGWYLKRYLSPPGAPQPTWSQQTQRGAGSVEWETGGGEPKGRKLETRWHETHMPPCSSLFTPWGVLSMGSIMGWCAPHMPPHFLSRNIFSAALIMGWCAPHMLPPFLSRNTFFLWHW